MSIKKITINVSILLLIIIIAFIGYKMIFSSSDSNVSTGGLVPQGFLGSSDKNNGSAEFLDVLLSVKNITFDTSVLQNQSFQSLQDFSVNLVAKPKGRTNPFAPFGIGNITSEDSSPATTTETADGTDLPEEAASEAEGLESIF